MRLIDADALKAEFLGNFGEEVWHYTGVRAVIDFAPTIDAVPTSELYELKNEMYENDGITMGNVAKLNALVSKYANGEPVQGIRHGHWIHTGVNNVYGGHQHKCSVCGYTLMVSPMCDNENYCCSCGAKMDEVSE